MKRRKNSSTSSSSIPGTWGAAPLRRTACVVLMLTTALPCSSTRRVKSGSSRTAWADARVEKRTSQAAVAVLTAFILSLSQKARSGLAILDCVGDALHARRRRFADYGHHVIGDLSCIDMDGAHAGKARPHRVAASLERLDENRYRRQTVRINHLPRRARLADPALELDHLVEARQLARQSPAGEPGRRRRRVLHAPALRDEARAHHLARHRADGELREGELLDPLVRRVDGD